MNFITLAKLIRFSLGTREHSFMLAELYDLTSGLDYWKRLYKMNYWP